MRAHITSVLMGILLLFSGAASAVSEPEPLVPVFENPAQEALYQGLVRELRCTVCQNQTLLDSNSGLAHDLRRNVYNKVLAGDDRESIIDFMVSRYGEFVLYKPRLNPETMLLWFGPLLFLAVGGLILAMVLRQQRIRRGQMSVSEPAVTDPARDPIHENSRPGR